MSDRPTPLFVYTTIAEADADPTLPPIRPASRADLLAALDKQWSCVAKVSGYYPCDGPVPAKALGLAHTHCHWAVKP